MAPPGGIEPTDNRFRRPMSRNPLARALIFKLFSG